MRTRFGLELALVLTVSASVWAQKVEVKYDGSKDFSQYHTYAWGSDNTNQIDDAKMAQAAKQDIDAQLEAKGLRLVEAGQSPDLIVLASGGTRRKTSYDDAVSWGNSRGTTATRTYSVGNLVVGVYDAKTRHLLWRGVGSGTLDHGNSQKNQQLLSQAIAKMFQQYPVPPKK